MSSHFEKRWPMIDVFELLLNSLFYFFLCSCFLGKCIKWSQRLHMETSINITWTFHDFAFYTFFTVQWHFTKNKYNRSVSNVVLLLCRTQFIHYKCIRINTNTFLKLIKPVFLFLCFVFDIRALLYSPQLNSSETKSCSL